MSAVKAALFFVSCFAFEKAWCHEGPPFPVVVDQPTAYGALSIWADPDVGEGTFMIFFEKEKGLAAPAGVQIRSDELSAVARRTPDLDNRGSRTAFLGVVPYAREGRFSVEVQFDGKADDRIRFDIDVTPPGPSRWQIWLFAFPFVALGFLWTKAILQRRRRSAC